MEKDIDRNIIETIYGLIKCLSVPVTKSSIISEIQNSNNKNLFGISQLLQKWKIQNAACQMTPNELQNEHCPFIAHISTGIREYEFLLVRHIDENTALISNENRKSELIKRDKLNKICTGAFLFVETNQHSGEKDYKLKRRIEIIEQSKILVICFTLAMVILSFFRQAENHDWSIVSLFILKSIGSAISILLVLQSLQSDNHFIKNLCLSGKYTSCEDVLSSSAAKIFPWLSWAEVGLTYFCGSFLALIFRFQTPPLLHVFFFLSIFNLCFIVYSLIFQAFILRKLCVLCCSVQLILLLEFITLSSYNSNASGGLGVLGWYNFILCFLLTGTFWIIIKPLIKKSSESTSAKDILTRFKHNNQFFKYVLSEQPSYSLPDVDISITIGKEHSPNIITFVSNPFCNPCSEAYKVLDEWLTLDADIQVRIIFSNINKKSLKIAKHLIALSNSKGNLVIREAFKEWYIYGKGNYRRWARKYPIDLSFEISDLILEKQVLWCEAEKISFTPLVTINGRSLPDSYLVEDLKYLI